MFRAVKRQISCGKEFYFTNWGVKQKYICGKGNFICDDCMDKYKSFKESHQRTTFICTHCNEIITTEITNLYGTKHDGCKYNHGYWIIYEK